MSSVSKNVYIDKLDDIVNKCNYTYHSRIKMKPVDVKSNIYIDSNKEINKKDPKLKIGDIVRISNYKNIFAKGDVLNWSEEDFVIIKVKNTVLWTYATKDLKGKEIDEIFYQKELQKKKKTIKKSLDFKKY